MSVYQFWYDRLGTLRAQRRPGLVERIAPYTLRPDVPENLKGCCDCGAYFPEPVTEAEALDYFDSVEDAAFACEECGKREGYPRP